MQNLIATMVQQGESFYAMCGRKAIENWANFAAPIVYSFAPTLFPYEANTSTEWPESGQIVVSRRQITPTDIYYQAFCSGDFAPIHIDADFAKRTIFKSPIAHALLVQGSISKMLAAYARRGEYVIYKAQSFKFPNFVPVWTWITTSLEITASDPVNRDLSFNCEVLKDGSDKPALVGNASVRILTAEDEE